MTPTSLLAVLGHGHSPYDRCLHGGGGKSAPVAANAPQITPPPPTEEASVQVDDTGLKKKAQGKAELKIPLVTATNTGLKV